MNATLLYYELFPAIKDICLLKDIDLRVIPWSIFQNRLVILCVFLERSELLPDRREEKRREEKRREEKRKGINMIERKAINFFISVTLQLSCSLASYMSVSAEEKERKVRKDGTGLIDSCLNPLRSVWMYAETRLAML